MKPKKGDILLNITSTFGQRAYKIMSLDASNGPL